jgi:large exoprotein involved in heme utilization and adhesion
MFIQPSIKVSLGLILALSFVPPTLAQIVPNGAGTVVNHRGNQINITGGTTAGANLFHSQDLRKRDKRIE